MDVGLERKFEAEGPEAGGWPYFAASWANRIKSQATYNRSVADRGVINKMFNDATETFEIVSSAQAPGSPPCYDRRLVALDGRITEDSNPVSVCVFPPRLAFCGFQLCEAFGDAGSPPGAGAGAGVGAPAVGVAPSLSGQGAARRGQQLKAVEAEIDPGVSRVGIDADGGGDGAEFVAVRAPRLGHDAVLLTV